MKLILGVLDQAYSDASSGGATTTGDVAEILEKRYHVMETFYDLHKAEIMEFIAQSMASAVQSVANGAINVNPLLGATEKIQSAFRKFLLSREMEGLFGQLTGEEAAYFIGKTGGFTGRASKGYSKRLKKPGAKRKSRPAFVDTGLYMTSFRADIEE